VQAVEPGKIDEGDKVDDLHPHSINFDAFPRLSA
jgi:hypothetical protein